MKAYIQTEQEKLKCITKQMSVTQLSDFSGTSVIKVSSDLVGDVKQADVVIIYGSVCGDITAENVVIVQGDVIGDINAKTVLASNIKENKK